MQLRWVLFSSKQRNMIQDSVAECKRFLLWIHINSICWWAFHHLFFFSPMNSIWTVNAFPCRIRFDCQKKNSLARLIRHRCEQQCCFYRNISFWAYTKQSCVHRPHGAANVCLNDDEKGKRKIKNNGKWEKRRDFIRITEQQEHKLSLSRVWFFLSLLLLPLCLLVVFFLPFCWLSLFGASCSD